MTQLKYHKLPRKIKCGRTEGEGIKVPKNLWLCSSCGVPLPSLALLVCVAVWDRGLEEVRSQEPGDHAAPA
jgi:hypothetical protein